MDDFFREIPVRKEEPKATHGRNRGQPEQMCLNRFHSCFTFSSTMKRPLFQHRMLSASALAAFFLAGSLYAQEPPPAADQPVPMEDSGISTPRRAAGLGVLAFLIGWMIWRSGSRRQKDGGQERDIPHDDTEPRE